MIESGLGRFILFRGAGPVKNPNHGIRIKIAHVVDGKVAGCAFARRQHHDALRQLPVPFHEAVKITGHCAQLA